MDSRIKYFLLGLVSPILYVVLITLFLNSFVHINQKIGIIIFQINVIISLLVIGYFTIKRAKETASSLFSIFVILIIFPPIGILYLLLAPEKTKNNLKATKISEYIMLAIFGIILLGIISGIIILRTNNSHHSTKIRTKGNTLKVLSK